MRRASCGTSRKGRLLVPDLAVGLRTAPIQRVLEFAREEALAADGGRRLPRLSDPGWDVSGMLQRTIVEQTLSSEFIIYIQNSR